MRKMFLQMIFKNDNAVRRKTAFVAVQPLPSRLLRRMVVFEVSFDVQQGFETSVADRTRVRALHNRRTNVSVRSEKRFGDEVLSA